MSLQTFIVDDEEKSRNVLKHLLQNFCPEINVVGEADGIQTALEYFNCQPAPDLVFFDIRLKEGDSFDILEQLDSIPFDIVFVTAYDEVSVKALQYSGIPCLLKPIDIDELVTVVDGIIDNPSQTSQALKNASGLLRSRFNQLPIETVEGLFFIDPVHIQYVKDFEGQPTEIYLDNGDVVKARKKLEELWHLLDKEQFTSIGDYVIQLNQIEVSRTVKKKVVFRNGKELQLQKSEVMVLMKKLQSN